MAMGCCLSLEGSLLDYEMVNIVIVKVTFTLGSLRDP